MGTQIVFDLLLELSHLILGTLDKQIDLHAAILWYKLRRGLRLIICVVHQGEVFVEDLRKLVHFISNLVELLPCVVTQLLLRILDQLNILGDLLVLILQLPTDHHGNLLLQSRLGLLRHRLLLSLPCRDDPFFLQALAGF